MVDRTTLALPIDVSRVLDHTVTQTQLSNNTFQATPDDRDLLESYIEDAEDEFRALTGGTIGIRRKGTPGRRETFEQLTYKVSGHKLTKGTFTGTWSDYLPEEASVMLDHDAILPFDSTADDAVYLYQGLAESGDTWEDVTDQEGEMWEVLDHTGGRFVFSPWSVAETILTGRPTAFGTVPEFIRRIRFAVSYRYGGLGGSRALAGATTLAEDITDTTTGTVSVDNAARLTEAGELSGSVILKVGDEYLRATVDVGADEIDIAERAVRGTNAVDPDSGDRVQYAPPSVRKWVSLTAGVQLIRSGRYSAYLPDSEDAIDKDQLLSDIQDERGRLTDAFS